MTGTDATPYARIVGNLEELGLGSMAATAGEHMPMVADGRKSFPEALLEMTSSEVEPRRERAIGKRVEKASFPYVKTLADFDWSFQPSVPRAEVEDLATLGRTSRRWGSSSGTRTWRSWGARAWARRT